MSKLSRGAVNVVGREPTDQIHGAVSKLDYIIDSVSDEDLQYLYSAFSPWSGSQKHNNSTIVDEDGFVSMSLAKDDLKNFSEIQQMCWEKFNENPQINSHVRDVMGSLTGFGFDMSSDITAIDDVIKEEMSDIRNNLWQNFTKFVARSEVEGELFLAFTLHTNGFVEVDFLDPSTCKGAGDSNSGIYFHPTKKTMPLFFEFEVDGANEKEIIILPSINIAHMPELAKVGIAHHKIKPKHLAKGKSSSRKYAKFGGYKTFIIQWDKGFFTKRNVSHIRTTLEWLNHYVNLKKWEIDHKRSSGAYLWVVKMTDTKALRTWLKMTDEEKKNTGLTAKKTPGGTLILPPGVEITCVNPALASISEQDTDIMHMVTSGLNKPEDMVTGQTKGDTFSGIKASRGPQADRVQDLLAYFERFLRFDFWRSLFFLRSQMSSFKYVYTVEEAVTFKDQEPVMRKVKKEAWELIYFDFPTSEVSDVEAKARALLGVKHPSVVECLGIPRSEVAKKLGFGSYRKRRLEYSTEEEQYPELPTTAELDAIQSSIQEPTNTTEGVGANPDAPAKEPAKKED